MAPDEAANKAIMQEISFLVSFSLLLIDIVREPNSENYLDLIFVAPTLWESYHCTRYKLYDICDQKIHAGYAKSL